MKRVLTSLLFVFVLVMSVGSAIAEDAWVHSTFTYAYAEPRTDSRAHRLKIGDEVNILGESGEFYIVELEGGKMYAPKEAITLGKKVTVTLVQETPFYYDASEDPEYFIERKNPNLRNKNLTVIRTVQGLDGQIWYLVCMNWDKSGFGYVPARYFEGPVEQTATVVEQPVVVAEQPVVEQPVAEQPVVEETVVEQPVAEESVVEKPAELPVAEMTAGYVTVVMSTSITTKDGKKLGEAAQGTVFEFIDTYGEYTIVVFEKDGFKIRGYVPSSSVVGQPVEQPAVEQPAEQPAVEQSAEQPVEQPTQISSSKQTVTVEFATVTNREGKRLGSLKYGDQVEILGFEGDNTIIAFTMPNGQVVRGYVVSTAFQVY